jgi:hypothetical protein
MAIAAFHFYSFGLFHDEFANPSGSGSIGNIHQSQMSLNGSVPQNAVIAQPQLLLLRLDPQFNRPALQIIGNHVSLRSVQLIGLPDAVGSHFSCSFQSLSFNDDQKVLAAFFAVKVCESVARNLLNNVKTVPCSLPEKFAVFGPIGREAKLSAESVESGSMTNCHSQNPLPEMAESRSAEAVFKGSQILFIFPGFLPIVIISLILRPAFVFNILFICNFSYHSFKNRSV